MSFAYRQYRQSKLSMHKARAKVDLEKCCSMLDGLKTAWHSAGVMAEMGKTAIKKASKICKADGDNLNANDQESVVDYAKRQDSNDIRASTGKAQKTGDGNTAFGPDLLVPFQVESPMQIPGQHSISSTRGDLVTEDVSEPIPHESNASQDTAFDNIDAVLGSYPDLNFPVDFADVLASLDHRNIHNETDNTFLG